MHARTRGIPNGLARGFISALEQSLLRLVFDGDVKKKKKKTNLCSICTFPLSLLKFPAMVKESFREYGYSTTNYHALKKVTRWKSDEIDQTPMACAPADRFGSRRVFFSASSSSHCSLSADTLPPWCLVQHASLGFLGGWAQWPSSLVFDFPRSTNHRRMGGMEELSSTSLDQVQ